ncbi:ATPase [Aureococcus anophagefferens]|nr:ATPase [Aureococcus anophagefferens]
MNDDDREAAKLKELAELKYEAPMSRIFGEFASKKAECDKYRPRDRTSPLRRANRNALAFVAIAVLQFVGVFSKMGIYRYIQEQMTAVAGGTSRRFVKMESASSAPDHSSGALTAALSKQTQLVAGVTGLGLGGAVSSACAILFGLGSRCACWRLSLAMLAMIPVIMMSMAFVFKLIMGDGGESGGAHSGASAVASGGLTVRTVARRAEASVLAVRENHGRRGRGEVGAAWKGGVAYGLGMAIIFTLYLVVFAFGPVCVDEGWCSPTDMWKALFCIMFGAFGAGSSAIFAQDANKAKIAAFDELAGLDLVFDAVSFAYPARREPGLDGLCLRVRRRRRAAFVGPSGSGKSTIIQLVQRFYEPSAGP